MTPILVITAIPLLAIVLHVLARYHRRRQDPSSPASQRRLYHEVLRELPLSRSQRGLLLRVARDLKLSAPTRLLLSPGQFSTMAGQWLVPARSSPRRRKDLQAVAAVLFPEDGPAGSAAPAAKEGS